MLEAILTDLYGARTLLTDRILEPSDVWASYRYRLAAIGQLAAPRWLTTYSVDVAKDTSGQWHVMQDLTDQPPGGGYTFMGRNVLARVHRDAIAALPRGAGLRSIDPFADQLRDALADLAKTESPRIVVMSGGVEHPSFVGQAYLASRLGLNLAEGRRPRRAATSAVVAIAGRPRADRRVAPSARRRSHRSDGGQRAGRRWRSRPARRGACRRRPAGELARHGRARRSGARRVVGRRRRLDRRSAPALRRRRSRSRRLSAERRRQVAVRTGPVSRRRRGRVPAGRRATATRRVGPQDRGDAGRERAGAQSRRRSERADGGDGEGRVGHRRNGRAAGAVAPRAAAAGRPDRVGADPCRRSVVLGGAGTRTGRARRRGRSRSCSNERPA